MELPLKSTLVDVSEQACVLCRLLSTVLPLAYALCKSGNLLAAQPVREVALPPVGDLGEV
jgi:hypothetical protein